MSLTLTDNRGFEADQLDLELDDADGKIVLPRRGAVITLALGWKGQPLFPNLTLRRRPHRSQFLTEQICTLAGIVQPVA